MTLAGDSRVRFSELEQKELAEYRPLNRFALVACVLGCIASVALIHRILCLFPLLGIITAFLAFRQLRFVENKQSGHRLALIGLFLSVLFGSWAVVRASSRELRLYGQARESAESWFALLREGRLYEAHQLTLKEAVRAAVGVSLENHYAPLGESNLEKMRASMESKSRSSAPMEGMLEMMTPPPHNEFEKFFQEPITKRLRDLGSKGQYNFRENVQILPAGANSEFVELVFVVSDQSDGSQKSFPIKITLERDSQAGVAADWSVARVADPNSK